MAAEDRVDVLSAHPPTLRDAWTRERNLDLVLRLFAEGALTSEGLVSHRIRPGDVAGTYEALVARPSDFLGVVIDWG
jgi:threonine dehydrogenase-like Zn-dependent dehydrogenase